MGNRSRIAAKAVGVVAAIGLVFGVVGPASAVSQDVEYALGTGTVTLPTGDGPLVFNMPTATGLVGTWDDETGAFSAAFSSAEYTISRDVTAPITGTITQRVQFSAPAPITGTIDPATGMGTVAATFNVNIVLESILIPPATDPTNLDFICTLSGVPVTYDVVATKDPADSLIFTNLTLTAQAFTVPAATCVTGPTGNPALLDTLQTGLNDALDLPNSAATSSLTLVAGAIPPPESTTTTTIATTTTTTAPAAPPAAPVPATARFTG